MSKIRLDHSQQEGSVHSVKHFGATSLRLKGKEVALMTYSKNSNHSFQWEEINKQGMGIKLKKLGGRSLRILMYLKMAI